VLFSGFVAWLSDTISTSTKQPKSTSAIRDAMAYQCVRRYKKAWSKVTQEGNRGDLFLAPSKLHAQHRQFMERIFYSIDAPSALADAYERLLERANSRQQKPQTGRREREVKFMVHLAAALHFQALSAEPPLNNAPKLLYAADAVLEKKLSCERSDRTVRGLWARYKKVLPFLYGAALIQLDGNTTLLDKILTGSLSYTGVAESNMRLWLGYAKYFIDVVVMRMLVSKKEKGGFPQLSGIEPATIQPPDFLPGDFCYPRTPRRKRRSI